MKHIAPIVTIFTAICLTAPAQASPDCMTKVEARVAFATSHLYWHGPQHCWDNRGPGRHMRPVSHKPQGKSEPTRASVPASDPNGNATTMMAKVEIYYPPLVREQATIVDDIFIIQRPITAWPLMLDIDALGPDPDNGIDGCCWPILGTIR